MLGGRISCVDGFQSTLVRLLPFSCATTPQYRFFSIFKLVEKHIKASSSTPNPNYPSTPNPNYPSTPIPTAHLPHSCSHKQNPYSNIPPLSQPLHGQRPGSQKSANLPTKKREGGDNPIFIKQCIEQSTDSSSDTDFIKGVFKAQGRNLKGGDISGWVQWRDEELEKQETMEKDRNDKLDEKVEAVLKKKVDLSANKHEEERDLVTATYKTKSGADVTVVEGGKGGVYVDDTYVPPQFAHLFTRKKPDKEVIETEMESDEDTLDDAYVVEETKKGKESANSKIDKFGKPKEKKNRKRFNERQVQTSRRCLRVAASIYDIISEGIHAAEGTGFKEFTEVIRDEGITIMEVVMTRDLGIANIYWKAEDGYNIRAMEQRLEKKKNILRRMVAKQLNIKFCPELRFHRATAHIEYQGLEDAISASIKEAEELGYMFDENPPSQTGEDKVIRQKKNKTY